MFKREKMFRTEIFGKIIRLMTYLNVRKNEKSQNNFHKIKCKIYKVTL